MSEKTIIDAVRQAIDEKRISQKEISEKTGIPQGNISKILNGKHVPLITTLTAIAEAAGVKINVS